MVHKNLGFEVTLYLNKFELFHLFLNCIPQITFFEHDFPNIGLLFSPGYPAEYNLQPDVEPDGCYYKLAAKNDYEIRLKFDEVALSSNTGSIFVYSKFIVSSAYEVAE